MYACLDTPGLQECNSLDMNHFQSSADITLDFEIVESGKQNQLSTFSIWGAKKLLLFCLHVVQPNRTKKAR